MSDEERRNALADVVELARMLHALRGLTGELERLLPQAMKLANDAGLSQAILAEAAALSAGRVSQMLTYVEASMSRREVHDRAYNVSEWPGDALRPYRESFTGRMTLPPYPKRRAAAEPAQGQLNSGAEGVRPWGGSARDATRLGGDLIASGMPSDEATAAMHATIAKNVSPTNEPEGDR